MKYDFLPCPVCKLAFGENDDIVVCPVCGTPHHRACYKSLDHCVFEEKHDKDFSWTPPITVPSSPVNPSENYSAPKNVPADASKEILPSGVQYRPISGDEFIGEIQVKTYGDYIKERIPSYIPKFLKMERLNKKASWNWAAFFTALFFPPGWFFYRKMYKVGLLVALATYIIPLIFMGNAVDYANSSYEFYYKLVESGATVSSNLASLLPPEPLSYQITGYINFAVILFSGLFANFFYIKKAKKDILTLRGKTGSQEEFDEKIKRIGGTSAGIAILSAVVLFGLFTFTAYIYSTYGYDVAGLIQRFIVEPIRH